MKACVLGKLAAVVLWLVVVAAVVVKSPEFARADNCLSEQLALPAAVRAAQALSASATAASRLSRTVLESNGQLWREIAAVVVVPSEYFYDPTTGKLIEKSDADWRAEVRTLIAQSNRYLRPLELIIVPVEIILHKDKSSDPYFNAGNARSAYQMLQVAVSRSESYDTADFDLALVLGRKNYSGQYGLAYPGTSCISRKYSTAFATIGGDLPLHIYAHAQTVAHEVGHVLGMNHDSSSDSAGPNIMSNSFVHHPYGFSPSSLNEARQRITHGQTGGSCFRQLSSEEFAFYGDRDWDGVSDIAELEQGSDPADAGSRKALPSSPVYTFWNSFLSMVNVLELVNPSEKELTIELSYYAINGSLLHSERLTIAALAQLDLIINRLPGFTADSYGIVKLAFDGVLEGRMAYYRNQASGQGVDYAFSLPFLTPSLGVAAVAFNTFNAARIAALQRVSVANWLTIVNLNPAEQAYRVHSFNDRGGVSRVQTVRVAAFGRLDLDGGHGFAGANSVGVHEIVAEDTSAPFAAFVSRYGSVNNSAINFAFALAAKHGSGRASYLPASTARGENNWLEVVNTSGRIVSTGVVLLDSAGNPLEQFEIAINPYEQRHYDLAAMLKSKGQSRGSVTVYGNNVNGSKAELDSPGIIAQSISYFYQADGDIASIYASQMREALGQTLVASHNLFLGLSNELQLTNVFSEPVTAKILIPGRREIELLLAANSTVYLALDGFQTFGIPANTYGPLLIESSRANALVGELLRIRKVNGSIDIALPTAVR